MYDVEDKFFTDIAKYGRQFDNQILVNGKTEPVSIYDINIFKHRFNAKLFQSVMRTIEVDSNIKIEKGSVITGKIGVKFDDEADYIYINYNNYRIIEEPEYDEDTKAYVALAYDKMREAMIDYDLIPTFPIKVREFIILICTRLGWDTSNIPTSFINSETLIKSNIFSNINYTFRDVLDEIAKITCSFPCFIEDKFTLKYITETGKSINNSYLKEDNLNFIKEYFINSVVFARAEDSDTFYKKNDADIALNGLHEYRLSNLQILSLDNRSEYMNEIYDYLATLRFWIFDIQTTGVFIFDIADKFTIKTDNAEYPVVLLNAEGAVEQGLSEQMYTDEPIETETDYKYSTSAEKIDNVTKILVDKQNKKIESIIIDVTDQNNKVARITQTVDELNSKISDIADITISQESINGIVSFEKINQSEPIYVKIYPRGENISYLYPRNNLYPSDTLFPKGRKLRFTNTTTNENIDYVLPNDLLYYDAENYDEFILDYDAQTCVVNKKVGYNADGITYVLENPTTIEYDFPKIELTDGDYTVTMLGYTNSYLFVRLMSQNIYTTQFSTKAEVHSEISQMAQTINLSVDKKLENYSTTTQMNTAISLKAEEITSTVSKTYATKTQLNTVKTEIKQTTDSITSTVKDIEEQTDTNTSNISTNKKNISTLTQTASSLQSQITNNKDDISEITQTIDEVNIEVGKKYNTSDFTNAKITAKLNNGTSSVKISADKIDLSATNILNLLSGNTINLSSKKITIASDYLNIDEKGNMILYAPGINVFKVINPNNSARGIYINDQFLGVNSDGGENLLNLGVINNNEGYLELSGNGYTEVRASGIKTPTLTQTSLENSKKNFEKLDSDTALDIILDTDIYKYNLKSQTDGDKKHIGFVIGNKYKYSKEITSENNDGADIYSMVSASYGAMQKLYSMIQNLQNQIVEIKGEK